MIDPDVSEKFKSQCDSDGRRQYKSLEGAIRLWVNLPSEVQSLLISSPEMDIQEIGEFLGRRLREALNRSLVQQEQSEKK